jgi:hypothetical protein
MEALSCNHCYSGKAIGVRYVLRACVYSLSYPACKAHAPYYIVIFGLSGSTLIYRRTIFCKTVIEHEMFVLSFSAPLNEVFLVLKRIQ